MRRPSRVAIRGSVAVVTGAGRGIGRETALGLAAAGATVVCADIDGELAEKVAAQCGEHGQEGRAALVDVGSRDAFLALAGEVATDTGPVDILVNNAGVGMSGRFIDMSIDDWEWIRRVNLDGVVNGCAAFVPAMVERGRGHVVNVSSALAYAPTPTEPAYVATKAAVLALSRCLRSDLARAGIGVTAVCPGLINTPIAEHTRFLGDDPDERRAGAVKLFRRGRKPERVARAIVDAIERDRALVMVGVEARIGWFLHRVAPVALQHAVARAASRDR